MTHVPSTLEAIHLQQEREFVEEVAAEMTRRLKARAALQFREMRHASKRHLLRMHPRRWRRFRWSAE